MYSLLPGLVSFVFLFYGLFAVSRKGLNGVTISFLVLCICTFFWQFNWAILFQVTEFDLAIKLIKIGWVLILFIPSALYHFTVELALIRHEKKWVYAAYTLSAILALIMVFTNWIIDGYYEYYFGFYPKAGNLHFMHLIQTCVLVIRSCLILHKKQKVVQFDEKTKIRVCLIGLTVYSFASIDYVCNYGVDFYPLGVIFIAISLAIFTTAAVKYHLMDGAMVIAASIAHELRTPLATMNLNAKIIASYMPIILEALTKNNQQNLSKPPITETELDMLKKVPDRIEDEATKATGSIDMLLAVIGSEENSKQHFRSFWLKDCVESVVTNYPYRSEKEKVIRIEVLEDAQVLASEVFLAYVLNNLISNALHSIQEKGGGDITIVVKGPKVELMDTGAGVSKAVLPHIFDSFFTTKNREKHAGVGLAFCKQTMQSFGGDITCESKNGLYTKFTLTF